MAGRSRNKGRIYGITPVNPDPAQVKISADLAKLLADGFTQRGDQELAALLSHPDRRARLEAQLELASRGDEQREGVHVGGQQQVRRLRWRACTPCGG